MLTQLMADMPGAAGKAAHATIDYRAMVQQYGYQGSEQADQKPLELNLQNYIGLFGYEPGKHSEEELDAPRL